MEACDHREEIGEADAVLDIKTQIPSRLIMGEGAVEKNHFLSLAIPEAEMQVLPNLFQG